MDVFVIRKHRDLPTEQWRVIPGTLVERLYVLAKGSWVETPFCRHFEIPELKEKT